MSDDLVTLRPVLEADLPLFEVFLTDPESAGEFSWTGWRDPRLWRRRWEESALLGDEGGALVVAAGAEGLGFVAWRKVPAWGGAYHWNIGVQLLPQACGKGAGTEAQRQLVAYLFAHSPVVRIEADTETGNLAEQRALEKAGFTREGVSRSVNFRDGEWRDGVRYSILRSDSAVPGSVLDR
ncbi:GNAT family N-acetyltransferase [Streptomyces beijiangensis]|uniref:GNAT family N-acetyltransferase n=1 Tax=Streptomyces beijiangensis TaxID=163361 RepID=A0A939FCY0_9ACTN|nr:GNAT family protein [Streptomyces beijiangensis]MBO0516328.1 GNAT family N-acetyltransferase [Streptomyces beijiangensis]